jgi:uncharacterized protein YndB with AHSA1/START domain
MSLEEVQVSSLIPASPNAIYAAWMDSRRHSAITGSVAVINPWVGGRVTARARFIEATHVKLETGKRILLAWRTQDFPADAPDSQVDVLLQPAAGGTKVSIQHSQIPAGHAAAAREIWRSLYLDPMKRYFGKTGAMEAAHRAATRAGQMPTADMVGMRHARTPITSAGNVSAPVTTSSSSSASDDGRTKPRRVILRKKKDGVVSGSGASASERPPSPMEKPKAPALKPANLRPVTLVAKPVVPAVVAAAPGKPAAAKPVSGAKSGAVEKAAAARSGATMVPAKTAAPAGKAKPAQKPACPQGQARSEEGCPQEACPQEACAQEGCPQEACPQEACAQSQARGEEGCAQEARTKGRFEDARAQADCTQGQARGEEGCSQEAGAQEDCTQGQARGEEGCSQEARTKGESLKEARAQEGAPLGRAVWTVWVHRGARTYPRNEPVRRR